MQHVATEITCADDVALHGHWWAADADRPLGSVVINCATGVQARYYHRYAFFLARHGFHVLTYDYRGIGLSRPESLRHLRCGWRHWGELDFDAAVQLVMEKQPGLPVQVVGHSIGGFLPGYAANASRIHRMLTVGAQHAYWRDYHPPRRMGYLLRWHLVMPAITGIYGYFPGRRLGWLEDLPAGVAYSWSFGGRQLASRLDQEERQVVVSRFADVRAPILAVSVSDDPFATKPAMRRALGYYTGSRATSVMLEPADLGVEKIGHFDLFHDRHASGFWLDTLLWLRDGINPWPQRCFV